MTTDAPEGAPEPQLVMPEPWVIDPLVRRRLTRVLAGLPDHVAGVVAPRGQLPPGSSYRVHAEWLALAGEREGEGDIVDGPVPGAALVRPGVEAELVDDGVRVPGRSLYVDHGSHVHDPWSSPLPIEPAGERGRSPFPRRPVVLFLKTEPDEELDLADWSRRMVNGLMRHDVEGRIARAEILPGLHLTRACLPTEESVHALRPDVVVTLDDESLELASRWCAPFRATVFVEYSLDSTLGSELVPWRLGRGPTRVRARVGQALDTDSLVRLVNRLCSGPQPLPPDKAAVDVNVTPLPVPARARSTAPRPVVVVREGGADSPGRLTAFLEHVALVGHATSVVGPEQVEGLDGSEILFVEPTSDPTALAAVVDGRCERGLRTVVDVGAAPPEPGLRAVVERGGFATAASASTLAALRTIPVRAQLLPTMLPPTELASLGRAGLWASERGRILFVRIDDDALTSAIVDQVGAHARGIAVERLAPGERLPSDALGLVWLDSAELTSGRPRLLLEAAILGVPCVRPSGTADSMLDPVLDRLTVAADAGTADWLRTTRRLLDSASSSEQRRIAKRAEARYGPRATAALAGRVVGWAGHEVRS